MILELLVGALAVISASFHTYSVLRIHDLIKTISNMNGPPQPPQEKQETDTYIG